MYMNSNRLGAEISFGDWGTFSLSDSTTGAVRSGVSDFLPDWLGGILFPASVEAVPTQPKINPIVVGGIAVAGLGLVMILAMNKKGNRRPRRRSTKRKKRKPARRRR